MGSLASGKLEATVSTFVQETKVCVFVIHIHVIEMRSVVWLRSVVESMLLSTSPPVVLNLRSAAAF